MNTGIWQDYQRTRNNKTRDEILFKYIHLVKIIVLRMVSGAGKNTDIDDMVSYGTLGLIDAIEKYDYSKGVKFETYAAYRIKGAIIDHWRKQDWVPRTARAKYKSIQEEYDKLEVKLGRQPTDEEVADSMGMSVALLRQTLDEAHAFNIISLDDQIYEAVNIDSSLMDMPFDEPHQHVEKEELLAALSGIIDQLPEKERLVVTLYYYEELTLKEIGAIMGVSESRVCQIHSKCIDKIRDGLKKQGFL